MEIKLNRTLSLIFTILLISIFLFGLPLISLIIDLIKPESQLEINLPDLLLANLSLTFAYLSRLIIGLWFYFNVSRFNYDRLTWLTIGLAYGQYGLILLGIIMIIQNTNSRLDLFKSLKPILILLIVTLFLSIISKPLLTPYLTRVLSFQEFGFTQEYSSYLTISAYLIVIIMNIIFATKLSKWIRQFNLKNKTTWIISTIFLGLFPIILFNELTIIKNDNKG